MAFKAKRLRVSSKSRVSVKLGYRVVEITLRLPIKQLAEQAVKAAFGKNAHINGKR